MVCEEDKVKTRPQRKADKRREEGVEEDNGRRTKDEYARSCGCRPFSGKATRVRKAAEREGGDGRRHVNVTKIEVG